MLVQSKMVAAGPEATSVGGSEFAKPQCTAAFDHRNGNDDKRVKLNTMILITTKNSSYDDDNDDNTSKNDSNHTTVVYNNDSNKMIILIMFMCFISTCTHTFTHMFDHESEHLFVKFDPYLGG